MTEHRWQDTSPFATRSHSTVLKLILILTLATVSFDTLADQSIKKSSSGICHASDSPHYERTTNYKAYGSLNDCLKSGGRLPKSYLQKDDKKFSSVEYSREKFGSGWGDLDSDCQDSRQEALIAQSTAPVRFKDSKGCRVTSGRWLSPYSGKTIHDPSVIDIDHVVPLKWAWEHGASKWEKSKRVALANDPINLLSVEASLNRQKGAKGPDEWLPPANHCQYLARFYRVVLKYGLGLSADEKAFKRASLRQC